jgi:hypothetical protein
MTKQDRELIQNVVPWDTSKIKWHNKIAMKCQDPAYWTTKNNLRVKQSRVSGMHIDLVMGSVKLIAQIKEVTIVLTTEKERSNYSWEFIQD